MQQPATLKTGGDQKTLELPSSSTTPMSFSGPVRPQHRSPPAKSSTRKSWMTRNEVAEFSLSALFPGLTNIVKISSVPHPSFSSFNFHNKLTLFVLPFHNNCICNLSYQFTKDKQWSVRLLTSLVTDSAIYCFFNNPIYECTRWLPP